MLIAIAGSIGAGKSTVALAVATRLGIPFHSIDDDKLAVANEYPEFTSWVEQGTPFPDDFRRRAFAVALDELAELARVHPHVIVEETFHRRAVRESFFDAAARLLGGMQLIEITVHPTVALDHLARRARSGPGHMAGRAMFEAFQSVSDPFDAVDLRVANNGALEEIVDRICAHLEGHV